MDKRYEVSLFIFRRDLRLVDNLGLIACAQQSKIVIPLFIYDPRQMSTKNRYKSNNAVQFMLESIDDLKRQLKKKNGKLFECTGTAEVVAQDLITHDKIDAVFFNRDYTPFARKRDTALQKICAQKNLACIITDDALLTSPEAARTKSGQPYKKFSAFFAVARKIPVQHPQKLPRATFFAGTLHTKFLAKKQPKVVLNKNCAVSGGSVNALKQLQILASFKNYQHERDIPILATTKLSAHNKFGTVSIRAEYHAIREKLSAQHPLIRQLYWRDFFTHMAYNFPYVFNESFNPLYRTISWRRDKKSFARWCAGTTGFPLVDAGMRELNTTGFMHNRVRMITASLLVKDLQISWQWGERYFAQKLIDYDPAVNNGNWQWVASTGADSQPYFRIFNPWTQQKKFDAHAIYIKRWIPELREVPEKLLRNWATKQKLIKTKYQEPMVDHDIQRKNVLGLYKKTKIPL